MGSAPVLKESAAAKRVLLGGLTLAWLGLAGPAAAQNIVVIIGDDMGVETLPSYGEGSAPAITPNLDDLANQGVLFRHAWAYPVCSPFRASVLTGLHPAQHGVGWAINQTSTERSHVLDTKLPNLASLLGDDGYRTAALGKWHLANVIGFTSPKLFDAFLSKTESHPNDMGFDYHAGHLFGGLDYTNWPKTTNGVSAFTTTYATTDTADEAIAQIPGTEPFFLWVAFNAPHNPWAEPPSSLLNDSGAYNFNDSRESYLAIIEAMDTEIGRFVSALDLSDTTVIFVGDNGTPEAVIESGYPADHSKATVYEGGVNVPLIIAGDAVAMAAEGGEVTALVQATDLFATVLEIAGLSIPNAVVPIEDSISLVPYLSNPAATALRDTAYSEGYLPNNGHIDLNRYDRAARDSQYKLVRNGKSPDELYDLAADPTEQSPLDLSSLSAPEQAAYNALHTVIVSNQGRTQLPVPALSPPALGLLALVLTGLAVALVRRPTG